MLLLIADDLDQTITALAIMQLAREYFGLAIDEPLIVTDAQKAEFKAYLKTAIEAKKQ